MANKRFNRVLITGASSGIGLAAAGLLARSGYNVVGTARDPEGLRKRLENGTGSPPAFALVRMDLTDPVSIDSGVAEAEAMLGSIDILINNGGEGELGAVEDTD